MNCTNPQVLTFDGNTGEVTFQVACGHCAYCLSRKKRTLTFLLTEEYKSTKPSQFLTLTYSDEHLAEPSRREAQLFIKRLRKSVGKFRYYLCSEHGELTQRPHYHLITFGNKNITYKKVKQAWNKGRVTVTDNNYRRMAYVAGYTLKKMFDHRTDDFALRSKHPPIGNAYLTPQKIAWHNNNEIITFSDGKTTYQMTRYFRQKIFPEGVPPAAIARIAAKQSQLTPISNIKNQHKQSRTKNEF